MDEHMFWLGFSVFPGVGPRKFEQLLQHFGTAKDAWEARNQELKKVLGESLTTKFEKFRSEFQLVDYSRRLLILGVSFLTLTDKAYPKLLKESEKPPFVLYVKGEKEILRSAQNDNAIAIVGTRKITQYGREVTEMFTRELVETGFTVVSGLAMGVDAVAHQTTIDEGGKTIAVLGCGVDCCMPSENQDIYNSIIDSGGCIVSELPLGHPPTIGSFPARNRIIAGLSQAVLVTEGAEDSGALITADYAFKYNRKVFAVPGPITSQLSKGPYKLIAKGAKLVTSGQDIIRELGTLRLRSGQVKNNELGNKKKNIKGDTKEERRILELLENEPLHFDEIVRRLGLTSAEIGVHLSILEMKGHISNTNATYSLKALQ